VAGQDFDLTVSLIVQSVEGIDPEPIHEHYAVVAGRRYPPKQVLALALGLDRADFTTHQARAVLRRVGFGVYRRHAYDSSVVPGNEGPRGGAQAELLSPLSSNQGRWVAQQDLEVLFDADTPQAVLAWLRRHNRRARVWQVPTTAAQAGSALTAP
jgi:hypothetical protein